jgi:hypothetical protein
MCSMQRVLRKPYCLQNSYRKIIFYIQSLTFNFESADCRHHLSSLVSTANSDHEE